ncbi:MAG TPA: hypothetical protein VG734_24695 [Lacunisphaera sp.]|nr:hypothetical protein [Lacunisphaera sp.]
MNKFVPFFFVAVLALVGCGFFAREVRIKDVTKDETLVLKRPGAGRTTAISITGRGSITGKAEVQLILNGKVYRRQEISSDIRFDWGGDWYAEEAEVRYLAGTATGGTLTLRYKFR